MVPGDPAVKTRPVAFPPEATLATVTHPVFIAALVHAFTVKSWPAGAFDDEAVTAIEPATVPYPSVGVGGVASWTVASAGPCAAVVAGRYPLEATAVIVA